MMKKKLSYILMTLQTLMLIYGCSTIHSSKDKAETLKDALKNKFLIGTALNEAQINGQDTLGIRIVKKNFNTIVAENCMKSQEIHPEKDQYNFALADAFVEFGVKNNMTIIGHTLVWHSQLPQWFCYDEDGRLIASDILKERMKEHIHTVVTRYKGKICGWDVVNEAINDDGTWRDSPFYQILGEEFIYLAFQYAHEADPNAELYYNDYNEWHARKRDAIVRMIINLKERGLRIDGIGMQGHIGMRFPSVEEFQTAIDAYTATGVKVMITEFDLSILPYARENVGANISEIEAYNKAMNPYTEGVPDSLSHMWNTRVMDFFRLFLKNSDKISRVTMWGVTDNNSWKNDFPMRGRTDYPLLFDRNYQAKTVVDAIISETAP